MHRVVLLALLLQLNFIHLILRNDLSFIAYIVLLDYTAQLGLLPFILPNPHSRRAQQKRAGHHSPLRWGSCRPGLLLPWPTLLCHQACEGPRVCPGTGLWVYLKHSAASGHLWENTHQA